MEYIHAFWVGGLICALVQILLDRTKLMPGRIMVLLVCTGAVLGAIVSALAGFCRSGSKRTAVRIRESSLERCQRGGRSGRVYRHLFGRLQGKCSRNQRRADLRISRLFSVQSENEKVRYL